MTSPRDYLLEPEQMGGRGSAIARALSNAPQQYQQSRAANEAIQKALYENMIKKEEAKNAAKNEEQKLLERELNNRVLRPKAEHAEEITAADLLQSQNLAKYTGEQAKYYGPNIQSEMASRAANTNRTNQLTPLEIIKQKIENDYAAREKEAKIKHDIAQANYYNQGGAGATAYGKNENTLLRGIANDNPQLQNDPDKIREARNVLTSGGNTLSDGTRLNPMSKSTSDAYSAVAKSVSDVNARQQQRFANTLETTFKLADKNADKAFEYAGIAGKAKQGFDAFSAQSGRLDPNYDAYNKFVNEDVPAMVTEIIRTGGAHSTNAQKATAIAQAMPINMKVNPKLAKSSYEELKKIYRAIGKTVSKGIGETLIDLNGSQQGSNVENPQQSTPQKVKIGNKEYTVVNGELYE